MNREHEPTVYRVEISSDGGKIGEIGPIALNHEEKWEHEVTFAPTSAAPNQRVDFLLYKGVGTEPYQTPHLWINVAEAP